MGRNRGIIVTSQLAGLWPPVATPFAADGSIDYRRLIHHSRTLLAEGAHGLAILGTTSEANSLTLDERRRAIDAHLEAGIAPGRLLPGTGASAIDDAAVLTRHAGEAGAAGALMLPPFFYKKVSDDGLFAFVARVIERAGPNVPPILLYHIPPIAGLGWSLPLIGRLIEAFPGVVVGLKDSSGDYAHTKSVIDAFPGFRVFPAAEINLMRSMADGAAGCISATANINVKAMRTLYDRRNESGAEETQAQVDQVRLAVEKHPLIPAVKAVIAARYRDPAWSAVRPPLLPLDLKSRGALAADPALQALPAPPAV
jgi:4-hydroxy-tetrahydrodipicolinate synthase